MWMHSRGSSSVSFCQSKLIISPSMAAPTCASCLRKAEAGFLRPCADIARQGARRPSTRTRTACRKSCSRHRRTPTSSRSAKPSNGGVEATRRTTGTRCRLPRPRRRHERNHIFRIGFLPGLDPRWGLLRRPFPRRGRIGKHSNRILARHQQIDCHEDARRQRCGVAHHLTPCVIAARPSSASESRVRFPRRRRACNTRPSSPFFQSKEM